PRRVVASPARSTPAAPTAGPALPSVSVCSCLSPCKFDGFFTKNGNAVGNFRVQALVEQVLNVRCERFRLYRPKIIKLRVLVHEREKFHLVLYRYVRLDAAREHVPGRIFLGPDALPFVLLADQLVYGLQLHVHFLDPFLVLLFTLVKGREQLQKIFQRFLDVNFFGPVDLFAEPALVGERARLVFAAEFFPLGLSHHSSISSTRQADAVHEAISFFSWSAFTTVWSTVFWPAGPVAITSR